MQRRHFLLATLAALAASPALAAAPSTATVVSYEGDAALDALAAKGQTVVYFYAAWCPECRDLAEELKARWNEVRPNLTLVIADYDKDKALKSRFGVTYQDTFVLLDKAGKPIKTWNGGGVDGLNAHTQG
jgi:thiol-disulfide isomerase/thioredoxin